MANLVSVAYEVFHTAGCAVFLTIFSQLYTVLYFVPPETGVTESYCGMTQIYLKNIPQMMSIVLGRVILSLRITLD